MFLVTASVVKQEGPARTVSPSLTGLHTLIPFTDTVRRVHMLNNFLHHHPGSIDKRINKQRPPKGLRKVIEVLSHYKLA